MPCDCGNGGCNGLLGNAPYLISPDDMLNSPPVISGPVISRMGRTLGANVYYFTPAPSGQIQTQSPKILG